MATDAQKAALAKARAARAAKNQPEESDVTVTDPTAPPEAPPSEEAPVVAPEPPRDPLEDVLESIVRGISPGRAREEADAALTRSKASGSGQQATLERRLHARLLAVADAHDADLERQAETQKRQAVAFANKGPDGHPAEPIPQSVRRGDIVHVHQDPRRPDTPALVLRLHPKVQVGESEHRWRADLALFPLHGSPSVADGVPYGHGTGQFSEAPEDESALGVTVPSADAAGYDKPWESRI